ncbi:hypothetical protein FRC19_010352 [Serendipita sp. 401]|nr:hypothetical protein FRC19_010352 [Serendipita sp. 401]
MAKSRKKVIRTTPSAVGTSPLYNALNPPSSRATLSVISQTPGILVAVIEEAALDTDVCKLLDALDELSDTVEDDAEGRSGEEDVDAADCSPFSREKVADATDSLARTRSNG